MHTDGYLTLETGGKGKEKAGKLWSDGDGGREEGEMCVVSQFVSSL